MTITASAPQGCLPVWAAQIAAERHLPEGSRAHLATLADALGPAVPDRQEARYLAWLAGWDAPTVTAIASLLRRARAGQ